MVYLDDILVLSNTIDEHLHNLETALVALDSADFKLNLKKLSY